MLNTTLNRTIWELKPFKHWLRLARLISLNRTIWELKRYYDDKLQLRVHTFESYHLGIETQPALNNPDFVASFESYHLGIETLLIAIPAPGAVLFESYHLGIETCCLQSWKVLRFCL